MRHDRGSIPSCHIQRGVIYLKATGREKNPLLSLKTNWEMSNACHDLNCDASDGAREHEGTVQVRAFPRLDQGALGSLHLGQRFLPPLS